MPEIGTRLLWPLMNSAGQVSCKQIPESTYYDIKALANESGLFQYCHSHLNIESLPVIGLRGL